MGESDEAAPFVVIRGLDDSLIKGVPVSDGAVCREIDQCVYMRSLVTGLSELPFELHDIHLEVGRRELGAAFLAGIAHRLEYVV